MFVRAYLRASTKEQDASRAREDLDRFAKEHGLAIASYYVENESGASLDRPELFRLLSDCQPGDILLVEQVDRLSRLGKEDWERLKAEIRDRRVKVVALDLPPSHQLATNADEFTGWMMEAFNDLMLNMLALFARKDYEDRRRRQAQGIEKAKRAGRYLGRRADTERNEEIMRLRDEGWSWGRIQSHFRTEKRDKDGKAIRDPKTGKPRFTTVSKTTLAKLDKLRIERQAAQ